MSKDAPENPLPTIHAQGASKAAAKSWWAHDPYAAQDSANARIADISKRFIDLFYKEALKRKCRVVTGVEIEGDFLYVNAPQIHSRDKMVNYLSNQIQKPVHEERRRNGIYRVYKDSDRDVDYLEVTTWPQKPLQTLQYVVAVKKLLLESTEEFSTIAPEHPVSNAAQRLRAEVPTRKLRFGEVSLSGEDGRIQGEHLNISLHHTDEDTPSHAFDLGAHNVTDKRVDNYPVMLRRMLDYYTQADALLLLHCPKSEARIRERYKGHGYTDTACRHPGAGVRLGLDLLREGMVADKGGALEEGQAHRVEWTRPDSGSDIHLSMLMALAGVYAMADATCKELGAAAIPERCPLFMQQRIENRLDALLPMPKAGAVGNTNEERIAQFQQQSMVLKMMEQVVAEAVPPAQQEAYRVMIAEFKDAVIAQSRQQFSPEAEASHIRVPKPLIPTWLR